MVDKTYLLKKIYIFKGKVLQYTNQTMDAWAKCKQTNQAVNELTYLENKSLIRELILPLVKLLYEILCRISVWCQT